MEKVSSLVEALGLAALVSGSWLFDFRAGIVVLGLVLILVGFALGRGASE